MSTFIPNPARKAPPRGSGIFKRVGNGIKDTVVRASTAVADLATPPCCACPKVRRHPERGRLDLGWETPPPAYEGLVQGSILILLLMASKWRGGAKERTD